MKTEVILSKKYKTFFPDDFFSKSPLFEKNVHFLASWLMIFVTNPTTYEYKAHGEQIFDYPCY